MKKYDAIWLTGQPASGKTTLANLLIKKLNRNIYNCDNLYLRRSIFRKHFIKIVSTKNLD